MNALKAANSPQIRGGLEQPCNLDAEESVLGGCLVDLNAIARIADLLPAEAFYVTAHKAIWRAIESVHRKGQPTDLLNVATWLKDQKLLDSAGGQSRLAYLFSSAVSAVNIDFHAQLVLEKYQRRQLQAIAQQFNQLSVEFDKPIERVIEEAESALYNLAQHGSKGELVPLGEISVELASEIEERANSGASPGIATGFYDLDAMTQGFQRSDLVICAGRPSMGKTAFAVNCATAIAQRHPVALFSLEMSRKQLGYRILSAYARVEPGRLASGKVESNQWEPVSNGFCQMSNLKLFVDDSRLTTVSQMMSRARRLQAEQGELGLIVIDYLQLLEGSGDNRVQELSKMTRQLKVMAGELSVPIVCLSQLSRGVESRSNKRPMMSDLRESGAIEQDADLILMMYRDEYYNPDTVDLGIAEVLITKHRNGPTGTVKLLFEPQFTQFKNLRKSA